jgi:CRP-like cAMP-binding protein
MVVAERGMVAPHLRGGDLFSEIRHETRLFLSDKRVQLVFGACEPHLLTLYLGQGARTYSDQNINSPDAGYLIPIVTVVEDVEYLRRIGSPEAEQTPDFGDDARIPACVDRLIHSSAVLSQRLTSSGTYLHEIQGALDELARNRVSALDGLGEEEIERCLGKSNIIECGAGDRLRNIFVVLDGTLEVRDDGKLLRVLSPGDVLGEIAFLLERPRTADVYAATDGVRVLSLSEGTIRHMIGTAPEVAAHLLLNISKILCLRIVQGHG